MTCEKRRELHTYSCGCGEEFVVTCESEDLVTGEEVLKRRAVAMTTEVAVMAVATAVVDGNAA